MCLTIDIQKHSIVTNPPMYTENKCYICRTARNNQKVYKIFTISDRGTLITPYQHMLINLNQLDNGLVTREDLFPHMTIKYIHKAIHAFTKYKTAIETLEYLNADDTLVFVVAMYIPKGTKLWYGKDNQIAAQQMRFYNKDKMRLRKLVTSIYYI